MLFDHGKTEICSLEKLNLSSYGKFLALMSQFNSAITYQHQLLEQLPSDHKDLPTIHNDLAYAYRESSKYEEATKHYSIALKLKENKFPRDEPDLATTYRDFGWLLMNTNHLDKSLDFHTKALAIRKIWLGDNHYDTAMSHNCLGFAGFICQNGI